VGRTEWQIILAPKHHSGIKQRGITNFMLQHIPLVPDRGGLNNEETMLKKKNKEEEVKTLSSSWKPLTSKPPMKCLKRTSRSHQQPISQKNHQGTTSSPTKSSKNCPLMEYNILHSCSMQSYSKGTSKNNGKLPRLSSYQSLGNPLSPTS
jgi:hypothetical protein